MLFSIAFILLLLPCHSLQTTANEKKTQAQHSHHKTLGNHSQTKLHTPSSNVDKSPPSLAKATRYLSTANRTLSAPTKPSNAVHQTTSKKAEHLSIRPHPIKVLISNAWIQTDAAKDSADSTVVQAKELDLEHGSPLVLTHQINLVPRTCGGCEAEFATLRNRLEHLEREVSTLKENCVGAEGLACFLRSDGNECPNDCSDQGRCEGGRCVCFPGYNGQDCGTAMCLSDCSNNGQCVDGQCVCDNGYSGINCANQSCPDNCNNHGRCVKGKCECYHGFMGTDCSTGHSGLVHLQSRDITDSSVTLFWNQPSVQYSTYHITFRSKREGEKTLTVKVGGRLTSFSQTGLAAGQKYTVSIRGERDGRMGPERTIELTTAPSGSIFLQVRDKTDYSVTLFWTQPSIQYHIYHITFQSQTEGDETITAKVGGRVFSLTQSGLAAGQKYKASIRGERDGKMGPESKIEFTTAPSGSVHLQTRDVTDSSVTLFWTQPSVQYSTYHITFGSQREGEEIRAAKIAGRLTSFTQSGLAAGQEYKASIRGERDGKMGPESTTNFTTAVSGSIHLRSKDITDSSVTVSWTQPTIEYSTYHITFKTQTVGDQTITAKVGGRVFSFSQSGLAAGQKYMVSIRGARDGKLGPESEIEFTTAPSGSVHLQTRNVTDSSVTLYWTQSSVQYSTYHITLRSQREGDKVVTANVGGRLTSFTQSKLAAGQKYKASIRGEKRDGKMGPESTTEFTTAPSGSVHLQSRDVTDSSVTLYWTQPSVQYSTYYITFRSQRDGDKVVTANVGGRLTSFTQSKLAAGQKYKASIRGEKRDGKMGPESTTEFTTAPSGFVHLQSRDITDSSVTLYWTKPSAMYSAYHITFKSQTEGDKMITNKVGGMLTSFTKTGLTPGQNYKVSIRGEREGKMGPQSTTQFRTGSFTSVHLWTRDITDSSVTLFWTQPSIQYSTFHITFKSQKKGDKIITAKVGGRHTSLTQTGLAAGLKYKVSIKGEKDGKMGPESSTEFTTASSGSVQLQSRNVTGSSVTLFWAQPSIQYSTYHITVKSQGVGDKIIKAKVGGTVFSFTQTGLAAGQKYKASIRGEKRDGKLGPESTTEFTTGPSGLIHLQKRHITDSSVTLFWTQPSVQYSTYTITFSREKAKDGKMATKVEGRLTSFTQTGLAAGSKYKVSIRGEKDGKTGPESTIEFTTAPSGSVHLQTRDVTDSSVTLYWTQPAVQYSTYHITLKGQNVLREGDKMITAKVGGAVFSFTQTGLAAGQKYKASIRGEKRDGKMGPESTTEFTTDISRPRNLHILRTSKTSVIVQWESPMGDFDSYRLSISPSLTETKGALKEGQHTTLPPHTDAANIDGLEEGRLYDIILTSQKGRNQSQPIRVQVMPGPGKRVFDNMTVETVTAKHDINTEKKINKTTVDKALLEKKVEWQKRDEEKSSRIKDDSSKTKQGSFMKTDTTTAHRIDKTAVASETVTLRNTTASGNTGMSLPEGGITSQTLLKQDMSNGQKEHIKVTDSRPHLRHHSKSLSKPNLKVNGEKFAKTVEVHRKRYGPVTEHTYGQLMNSTSLKVATDSAAKIDRTRGRKTEGADGDIAKTVDRKPTSHSKLDVTQGHSTETISRSLGNGTRKYRPWTGSWMTGVENGTGQAHTIKQKVVSRWNATGTLRGPSATDTGSLIIHKKEIVKTAADQKANCTGPESPSELLFSKVTHSSLSVSWERPKSPVTGFRVTYRNTKDGASASVSVEAKHSSVTLSNLSPGSSYEVRVASVLGMKESDPAKALVITAPDPPTGILAVNVTNTKALLVWEPAKAAVDYYHIIFRSDDGPDKTVKVVGNNFKHQLKDLHDGTKYTVTVFSQLDSLQSTGTTITFTTAGVRGIRREESSQEMSVSQLTPRSAVLSWKPPNTAVTSYRLTYQRAGQEAKEVIVGSTITNFKLSGLSPLSKYIVRVLGEWNGRYITVVSTEFKTGHREHVISSLGSLRFPFPTDCSEELLNGVEQSGEVEVFPGGRQGRSVRVYCDMETDGGGWTVFQRRLTGKTVFFRGWNDYSYGFGNLTGEFWLGNENIHSLTVVRPMALRVELRTAAESAFAYYSSFYIESQRKHYALSLSGYSGTAGDSMKYYDGRPFSTHDKDPQPFSSNCAISYRGGWWHKNCNKGNINGLYNIGATHQGVIWNDWKDKDFTASFTEMKLRPASFPSQIHS